MENLPFTTFDLVAFGVLLLSALMAFSSGLVRAILFVLSWIGAAVIAYELLPSTREYGRSIIPEPLIADIATAVVLFVVALVVLSVFTDAVSRAVHGSAFRGIDRLLGLAFGVLLGGFLISAVYLVTTYLVPPADMPSWVREAKTLPAIEAGANLIDRFVPEDFKKRSASRNLVPQTTPAASPASTGAATPQPEAGQGTLTPADRELVPPASPNPPGSGPK